MPYPPLEPVHGLPGYNWQSCRGPSTSATGTGSCSVTFPAGSAPGDFVIAVQTSIQGVFPSISGAGMQWFLIGSQNFSTGNQITCNVWLGVVGAAAPPASVSFSFPTLAGGAFLQLIKGRSFSSNAGLFAPCVATAVGAGLMTMPALLYPGLKRGLAFFAAATRGSPQNGRLGGLDGAIVAQVANGGATAVLILQPYRGGNMVFSWDTNDQKGGVAGVLV